MKRHLILLFLFLCLFNISAVDNYPELEIGTIKDGKGVDQIDCSLEVYGGVGHQSPMTYSISKDGRIFITDDRNKRIAIFDLELNYLGEIINSEFNLGNAYGIILDEYGENIFLNHFSGFLKIDKNGNTLYFIEKDLGYLLQYRAIEEFYLIHEYVFYYDKKDNIRLIDPEGNMVSDFDDVIKVSRSISSKIDHNDDNRDLYFFNKNLIHLGNRLYTRRSYIFNTQYRNYMEKIVYKEKFKDRIKINDLQEKMNQFIGFDLNNSIYWETLRNDERIIVFSKLGELIDEFNIVGLHKVKRIAPNGDIYSWRVRESGVTFYKFKNVWDTNDFTPHQSSLSPIALTASTFIDYLGMYAPSKAFDGQPETGWIEAGEGPGKGDYIKLEFANNITIDAIEVMPGYFDKKWWVVNNRVKQLKVFMDDTFETLNFEDIMEPQMIKLKEPVTFRKIEFIIRDVYLSGKDNDTAIAEIGLYYQGEKLELDISGIE